MVLIAENVRAEIRRHAADSYPCECCGVLLGVGSLEGGMEVKRAVRAENVAAEGERRTRYLVEPLAIVRADGAARAEGLEIVGFYHSHPDHSAEASATDGSLAWPDYVYVICSVAAEGAGGAKEVRAWRLMASGERMVEIVIVPG